jgi:phage major head subunit gpT-like protein
MFDLESRMRLITSTDYQRLTSELWWKRVAKEQQSGAKKERVTWLLDTAQIKPTGKGGNLKFEDIVSLTQEVENANAGAGLELKKEQFEDLDGNGVQLAAHWSRGIGSYSAYWPQKSVAKAILANPVTYDTRPFFDDAHPVNPYNPVAGTYTNWFHGTASGANPGLLPIGEPITPDAALQNLAKAVAWIHGRYRMPNGEDPRFLKVGGLLVPPALGSRAQQLTDAKFIAQAATTGGGSGDVEAVIRKMGFGEPIEVPELSAGFPGGSDTDYYLLMEDILSNDLGAFTYWNREAFSVLYYGPTTDAQLARIRLFQWSTEGRNVVGPGHPFLLVKVSAT